MIEEGQTIELSHVAALSLAIWIYLIDKDEEARGAIAALADKLEESMNVIGEDVEEERTQQDSGPASNGEG